MSKQAAVKVYTEPDKLLPRFLIRGMLLLICAVLAITIFARVTDRPLESTPPVAPVSAEAWLLLKSDGMTGAVTAFDPAGQLLLALTPEQGGFIAGVHRVILRERLKHRVAADSPVLLQSLENGRMLIVDPETGWRADLMGFGAGNADTFAKLLAVSEQRKTDGILVPGS